MLCIQGYQVAKKDVPNLHHLKGMLTVKPYIPSVFVKPQYVQKYPVFLETEEYLYVPKHYGIQTFGPPKTSLRDIQSTSPKYWEFSGALRPSQQEVVDSFLKPEAHDGAPQRVACERVRGKVVRVRVPQAARRHAHALLLLLPHHRLHHNLVAGEIDGCSGAEKARGGRGRGGAGVWA